MRLAPDRPIVLEGTRLEGAQGVMVNTMTVAGLPIQIALKKKAMPPTGPLGAPIALFDVAVLPMPASWRRGQFEAVPRGVSPLGQGRNILRGQSVEIFVENTTDRDQTVVWWIFHSTLGDTQFYVDPQAGDIPDPTADEFALHCEIGRIILEERGYLFETPRV